MTTETLTPEQQQTESDEALNAGFNEARGEEPAPAAKPQTAQEQPQAPAAQATEAKADPWAGMPAGVKAEFDALRETVSKVPDRLRNLEGHIGGLTTATRDIRAALDQARTAMDARGKEAPTQAQVAAAAESDAQWKQLKEDFPEWALAVDDRLKRIEAAAAPKVDPAALRTELTGEMQRLAAAAKQDAETNARRLAYLDLKHEGWTDDIATPEFEAWYAKQPKDVQALSASLDVKDASKMIGLYRDARKKAADDAGRQDRLKRAVQPEGAAATAVGEDPDEAFNAGFNAVRRSG